MSRAALPLQLLLILALVLNGIGGAMASAMLPAHNGAAGAAVPTQAASPGDCIEHAEASTAAEQSLPLPASDCHSNDEGDCGDSPQCLQACLHASVAVAPVFFLGVQPQQADAILHPLAGGHPAPPLPSPIRPPIA